MKEDHQQQGVDTDEILKTVYHKMSLDLAYLGGIEGRPWDRNFSYGLCKWSDPYVYKAKYQLNTLLKRYVTKDETCNVEVNRKKSYDAFIATQSRVSTVVPKKLSTYIVIQEARKIIKKILGPYEEDEHIWFCRFGKRAATGLNYRESYLDKRVETLTGSKDHIQWFQNKVIPKDDLLERSIKGPYTSIETLALGDVDKSWDKRRTILKNTVLGGFHAAGLGDYIVKRLKLSGYHLARRAEKHRAWIRNYSRNLQYVTADLSAASDSFTLSLMMKLFPRRWINAMKLGRINNVLIDGKIYHLSSFMTMGVGFTFPAQTIAFYAILKAIRDLHGFRGRVSAFGDDLIYPTRMHPTVVSVLTDVGFLLNMDKTFVDIPFRESCGADYYDGIDVRPYQPEGKHEILRGLSGLSYLYKIYNGLQQRWLRVELPKTFSYLLGKMQLFTEQVHQVPFDFPVTSGIQTKAVLHSPEFRRPYTSVHGDFVFQSLSHKSRLREVPIQTPYLWECLRQSSRDEEEDYAGQFLDPLDSTLLQWKTRKTRKSRHNKPPIWLVRLIPYVSEKGQVPRTTENWNLSCNFRRSEVDNNV